MRLTEKTDLALRVLVLLATRRYRCTTANLALWLNAPSNHIAKVTQALQSEGWVSCTRGRSGGVELCIDPRQLRVGQVVRRIESGFDLAECFREGSQCPLQAGCSLAQHLASAAEAFLNSLDKVTLAEVAGTSKAVILRITA